MEDTLVTFLAALYDRGEVQVGRETLPFPKEGTELDAFLGNLYERECLEMPLEVPPLDLEAARWAAWMLHRGCQFLVVREISGEEIKKTLTADGPNRERPSVIVSVDLAFRFLPDLLSLAKGMASEDPLNLHLRDLALRWPLSSVGAESLGTLDLEPVLAHACLRCMHTDRVIARFDKARLQDRRVLKDVEAALGAHPELSPPMAEQLALRERSP